MNEKELLALYLKNNDFQMYLDEYCKDYHKTRDEALTHAIVRAVALIYATIDERKKRGSH